MEKIREFMQSWLGKVVLLLVLAPMALLGVQQFGGRGMSAHEVVKVGSASISLDSYNNELNAQKQELLQNVDASLIDEKVLSDNVLQSMIDRALLENQTKFLGLTISDEAITRLLQSEPTFHDENGQFSDDKFATYLQQNRLNKNILFANFRTQLTLRQLTGSILQTAIYSDGDIAKLIDLQTKSREVWVHRYRWQDFADKVSISDDEIASYYTANQDKLTKSETVVLSYVALNPDSIKVATPTDDELRAEYQLYIKERGLDEANELAQILFTGDDAKTRADEVVQKLQAGESFESLAKTHSDDPSGQSGGLIGTFNPDVFGINAQDVQNAIANLAVGQTSQPVKTAFGYHIFKVVNQSSPPSFDELKDEVTKQAMTRKHQIAIDETIAKIDTMAVDGVGLSDIAKEANLTISTINEYPLENNTTELSMPLVVAAVFDETLVAEQRVSPHLRVGQRVIWVQPSDHQPSKILSQDEAKPIIVQTLTKQKAIKLAHETAIAKADEARTNPQTQANASTKLGMVNMQSGTLSSAEKSGLFSHHADGLSVWAVQTDDGASVLVGSPITTVHESQLNHAQRLQASMMIRINAGQDQLSDYLKYLQDSHKVEINHSALSAR
ncbi:MAG: SurA N-terminal domain-containing protein [Moraxella sp.]|nr:SurA N-terminal domain-containing protein [Moraxella sp.]